MTKEKESQEHSQEQKRIEVSKKIENVLSEYNAKIKPSVSFPMYNKLPVDLELALQIINKHEPQWVIELEM